MIDGNILPFQPVQPATMLEYALRYAALGWHVFPVWGGRNGKCKCGRVCQSPGKHPVSHLAPQGQDNATTVEDTIKRWWGAMPEAGIAVFLQPSGLVAIDIDPRNGGFDTIDEVESQHGPLQSEVMQFTQGGGEHRIFKLAAENNIALPGKLGPGVDVKRNGYIVLAPTQGVSGKYDWEASSDPLTGVVASPLPDWMRDLGRPVQMTEQVEPRAISLRHVTPAQVEELRDALRVLPAEDRGQWVRFGLALRPLGQVGYDLWTEWSKTSAKYCPVDQIRKWRGFNPSSINFESIFFEAQSAGWVNPLAGSGDLPLTAPLPATAIKPQPASEQREADGVPVDLLQPPGILGMLTEWIGATARKPQPQFDVQAAIAFASVVMGRRFCTDQRNWPSLYLLNIGKSASGKEHAKWAIESALDACGLGHLIGPAGYTSDSGLLSSLNRQPAHVTIVDEFGKQLEAASIKHGARAASTLRALMEAWGRCDGILRPQGYSTFGLSAQDVQRLEDRSVRNPALTLLAMTTPESFYDAIGSAAARDGFLNRFIIVESEIGRQAGKPAASSPPPDKVIAWAKSIHTPTGLLGQNPPANLQPVPKVVPIPAEAGAVFASMEQRCIKAMNGAEAQGLAEMWGRTTETAMRLALIVAVADGAEVISEGHAQWAARYVEHYTSRAVAAIEACVADSEHEGVCKQVLNLIKQAGSNGLTECEINRNSRRFRALDLRNKIGVLASVERFDNVRRVEFQPPSGRGRARVAFVDAGFLVDNGDKTET